MRKTIYTLITLIATLATVACNDYETYSDLKNRERDGIEQFISDSSFVIISEDQFHEQGDKTILDALIPIHDCFLPENVEDKNLFEVLQEASKAAGDGVNYTKEIPAKKGRASLVGERSIGVEDPGAVSTMLMYRALYQFLKR